MIDDIAITKMSTKGQIVIPLELRRDYKKGEKLILLKIGENLILKKASTLNKKLLDDLKFAKKTEEAYRRHERGEYKRLSAEKFLKMLEKW
jgi:bifunctional DNA-binding transcriptional regulator/antitoxin component of YhaV-PrlF toxin-antitoxin module